MKPQLCFIETLWQLNLKDTSTGVYKSCCPETRQVKTKSAIYNTKRDSELNSP